MTEHDDNEIRPQLKALRDRISALDLVSALERHIFAPDGDGTMTPAQVAAALALLKKILPDMKPPREKPDAARLTHEDAIEALD